MSHEESKIYVKPYWNLNLWNGNGTVKVVVFM